MKSKEYYYLENNESVGPLYLVELIEIIDRESLVWYDGIEWTIAYKLDELKKFFSDNNSESNKGKYNREYYYLENNESYGPVSIVELLEIINRETMVWHDGIEWTIACKINELKKFFPEINTRLYNKQYYYNQNNKSIGPLSLEELLVVIDRETMVWHKGINWTIACELEELQKYFPFIINEPLIAIMSPVDEQLEVATPKKTNIETPFHIIPSSDRNKLPVDNPLFEIIESLLKKKSKESNDKQKTSLIIKELYEELKKVHISTKSCMFITPDINIHKYNNLKSKVGNIVGNYSDCLLYYDNTLFGAGDNGFIATKNIFAWNYGSKNSTSIAWKEIECFKIGKSKYDLIIKTINKVEYTIKITLIPYPETWVEAFNELLVIFK